MRVFVAALLSILAGVLLVWLPAQGGRSTTADSGQSLTVVGSCAQQQAFQGYLQSDSGDGPHFMLRNFCDAPLTAVYLQIVSLDDGRVEAGESWDALMQRQPPVPKGEITSIQLFHRAGQRFSAKVDVGAAVWADGSTFGNPELLRRILSNRAVDMRSCDWAISLLQQGLQQNWNRDQYIAALDQKKKEASVSGFVDTSIPSNLQRNPLVDAAGGLQHVLQRMTEIFAQKRDLLRQSKPDLSAVGNSI
jgi:hypothetical protein